MIAYMASRETRRAREDLQKASDASRQHERDCLACIRAKRRHKPDERCPEGWCLYKARKQAAERLRQERELDKAPIPGQGALFEPAECGSSDAA